MCIRVQYVPLASLDPWDAERQLISIPAELAASAFAVRAVRAVLSELAIPQGQSGARCWCGEPVRLLTHIPKQRRSDKVIKHG